jgi:hypothetical protein
MYYKTPILSSDLKNIKSIFNDTIKYFSPISVNSIYEAIKSDIINPRKTTHYNEIIIKYSKEKTIAQLLDIIN